jgi:small neutral amino acid transporter SnatA (MarC family)
MERYAQESWIFLSIETVMEFITEVFHCFYSETEFLLAYFWLKNFIIRKGVNALERLMGLILVMPATQMSLDGIRVWMKGEF